MNPAASVPATPANPPATGPDLFAFVQDLATDLGRQLDLPGFPDMVMRLHRTLSDERAGIRDIVRLINSEPALAARLLQVANSAAFNTTDHPVSQLRAAITLLGFNTVRSVVTSFAIRQLEQQEWLRAMRPALGRIWRDSTGVAAVAAVAALRLGHARPDECLAAGLFHQLGSLYVLTRAHQAGVPIGDEERWMAALAGWHPTIARAILESWGMPEHLAEAVERQDVLLVPDEEPDPRLPPVTATLGAAKVYHVLLTEPAHPERATLESRLRNIQAGNQNVLDVLRGSHAEIEKVRQVIGR